MQFANLSALIVFSDTQNNPNVRKLGKYFIHVLKFLRLFLYIIQEPRY